jgi:glycosyltransferase involved in cell wall biosynthesis
MKVIVNAAGYVGQSGGAGGAGVFLQYLIGELARSHSVDVLVPPNSKTFGSRHRGARFIELPYVTDETLRHLRDGPTVIIDPFGALPCAPFPDDIALCVIVHDLMHLVRPQFFSPPEREERSIIFARGLERADAVVVFSADTARATKRFFPSTSPVVIPHLPYAGLRDGSSASSMADVSAYEPFLLFPAVKWPHKNHSTVIAAFGAYVRRTGSNLRLVLCGGPCAESRFSYYPSDDLICDQIDDLGLVSEPVLQALFHSATAVVFPTLYEGFGIPVLESAYLGKMVLASRLDVFDEILGARGYRAVEEPRCELRWMEAFAEAESSVRADYEATTRLIQEKVDPARFASQFTDLLKGVADRYSHPALYPVRTFLSGDRPTSSLISSLTFSDIHATSAVERGTRQPALGGKIQASTIFRSNDAPQDRKVCLRAHYDTPRPEAGNSAALIFSTWVRLTAEPQVDAINWAVNDGDVFDLLPELRDREWHLVRRQIPNVGFIDFRAVRNGVSEAVGFDIEIHDPCLLSIAAMPVPAPDTPTRGLTVYVAATSEALMLGSVIGTISAVNGLLPQGGAKLQWIIVASTRALGDEKARHLPANVRVQIVGIEPFERVNATSLASPYEPVDLLLLLDADDLEACLNSNNLAVLTGALGLVGAASSRSLLLDRERTGFWLDDERGHIMSVGHRTGQPIPVLDREVIRSCLSVKITSSRPRFAVIETDLTGSISHHSAVTGLFLEGAEACGFQPVLGLNHAAVPTESEGIDVWTGFGPQVYTPGIADVFEQDLAAFVRAKKLGSNDLVFMHSLSPQIVLGAARFVASNAASSPHFAMRFFSTAEAMAGHKLSYVKILKSIEAVHLLREKMHFFCESKNLIDYYEEATGRRYPLLLNPEHPSLAAVRNSDWFDPALGGGKQPILAYFGEARAEKGFDYIPAILDDLLANPAMDAFGFLIQTGSNSGNQTPEMAQAKAALYALKRKHPDRVRTFESAATPEEFYFLMKHARGIIAPYRPESYGARGTGVTLEALQMGLDVFAWVETDLYATFQNTGRLIGVTKTESFAEVIARYCTVPESKSTFGVDALRQAPSEVCARMISLCTPVSPRNDSSKFPPVLWVGNDTFGEGNSFVYASQKHAIRENGRDCFELFVPWPDRSWRGVGIEAYDGKVYGFDSEYEGNGLAWVAYPNFNAELDSILDAIEAGGTTYTRLRDVNKHMVLPASLARAIQANQLEQTILNYAHLYPLIEGTMPLNRIVCETHDIISYQYAARQGSAISLTAKIDEFSDLSQFPKIIAISLAEQREMERACPASEVFWRLPPHIPEAPVASSALQANQITEGGEIADIPEMVARPSPLMLSMYQSRPDLQEKFDLNTLPGRIAFFRWTLFNGQFESGGNFVFTKAQYDWLVNEPPEKGASPKSKDATQPKLSGLLIMMLSFREDVRKAFIKPAGIDVDKIQMWAKHHGEQEFGFSRDHLVAQGQRHFARSMMIDDAANLSALDAVIAAGPMDASGTVAEKQARFERISEIGKIDLVMVGSGHPANIASFDWFLKNVYLAHLAGSGRSLFIVGSAGNHLRHHVHRNIVFLGRCRRIEPMLMASRACPLPVIAGSGSPIKTIPALAVNGAVTVTDRIDQAFGLTKYGIPSFSDPKAFADDLYGLVTDDFLREERIRAAQRYVDDQLSWSGYVDFWRQRLDMAG